MRTGQESGLVVLDIDAGAGDESAHRLQAQHGALPDTPIALTGGGGFHVLLHHPGSPVPCSAGKVAPGLDIRADGGYVIAPGSVHESGERYRWLRDPADTPLAVCPTWLLELATVSTVRPPREPMPFPEHRGDDPLLAIPATEYIPILTGRPADMDGKVTCPWHGGGQERTPSLHAYDDPAQGWFCFGCTAGGSIIDFAARLYGVAPRGRGYHAVRERLVADLLGRRAA